MVGFRFIHEIVVHTALSARAVIDRHAVSVFIKANILVELYIVIEKSSIFEPEDDDV